MSGSAQWLLQDAIYTRINVSSVTTAPTPATATVHAAVPDAKAFPYAVIGEAMETPEDTMGTTGRYLSVTVHTWSQRKGYKEIKLMQSAIDALLDRWTPTLTGWNAGPLLMEFVQAFPDADGLTRHGVQRYRMHAHQ